VFSKVGVALTQLYRKATHIRRFEAAVRSPDAAQEAKLLQIVRANQDTAFGKKHKFDQIKTIADYQKFVPPAKYEDLHPYIENLMNGETKQLSGEEPFMFATTSGTTAQPKFLPITESHLRDYTHAFQVHNYHIIDKYPAAPLGKVFIITSNDQEGLVANGAPYGAVSGLLNRRQPQVIRDRFAIPYELCKIKDVDTKYYLMLRVALAQRITAILCCNPSSLLLLSDQMKEHAADLVQDITNGTVKQCYAPPPALEDAFKPFFKADPTRGRELKRLLDANGVLTPQIVWPDMETISCWKGGPMSFYLEKLSEFYGNVPIRDFGYMASEGRGSIPISDDGAGGVVAITSHFFEFVEEDDVDSPSPKFLTVGQLKQFKRYYIYFTTIAGLYRYDINDLIEVVGFHHNTPVIQFVRKGLGISSITGEKLTEEQVLVALTQALRQLNIPELSHFTAEVELGLPPYYVCYAELNSTIPDSVRNEFIRLFDHSLKMQNPEYADKRATKRLGMPVFKILPHGTYTRLRQQRVSEGAPEAQVKIPLLSTPKSFSDRLASLPV